MLQVFGDLHIHVGSAGNRAVKVTASRQLTLKSIIFSGAVRKGLEMVGVVDAVCTGVALELEQMIASGFLSELEAGGLLAANGILVIPAAEIETREGVHVIVYLPGMEQVRKLQKYLHSRVKNRELSTQKANLSLPELINMTYLLEGIFCPAHVFTPHKGIYGFFTDRLSRYLGKDLNLVRTIELGLSADTDMADMLRETRPMAFLSNSDAHSQANMGREYNLIRMGGLNFTELKFALANQAGRRIIANYGMDPLLGKYHRSYCSACATIASAPPPVTACERCGDKNLVMGVYDRIVLIRDQIEPSHPLGRPLYHYRVPLKDFPGIGPKTQAKLLDFFGDEINVLERARRDDIARIAGDKAAAMINHMRLGRLNITPGGGGYYGRVQKHNSDT